MNARSKFIEVTGTDGLRHKVSAEHVVAVLQPTDQGSPIVGQSMLVVFGCPPMIVRGTPAEIADVIDHPEGHKQPGLPFRLNGLAGDQS